MNDNINNDSYSQDPSESGENEKINEEVYLEWQDIIQAAGGRDEDGIPRSTATLAIDYVVSREEVQTLQNVVFRDAVVDIFTTGGCAVVQADFPQTSSIEYNRATAICKEWLDTIRDPEKDMQLLTLTVVPLNLYGQIYILFNNLAYFASFPVEDANRLILVFDNLQTQVFEDGDINYAEIYYAVESELKREEDAVDEEIAAAIEEKERIEQENIYGMAVKERYDSMKYLDPDKNEEDLDEEYENDEDEDGTEYYHYGNVRKRKDSMQTYGMRIVKEDDDL